MSTLAIWSRVVQSHDVSPHNFGGLAMSVLAISVAPLQATGRRDDRSDSRGDDRPVCIRLLRPITLPFSFLIKKTSCKNLKPHAALQYTLWHDVIRAILTQTK